MTKRRSAPRFSRADEARLQHAMKAGLRVERDWMVHFRAQLVRWLAKGVDDDLLRDQLGAMLRAIDRDLPHVNALVDDE